MRIVAGTHRGRRFAAPPGDETRPTADRVREALFSIIGPVDDLDVIDLFAGLRRARPGGRLARRRVGDAGGALGPCASPAIRANVESLGMEDRVRVVGRDWRAALAAERAAGRTFGLCLCDPPYSLTNRVVAAIGAALAPLVAPPGIVVIEHSAALDPPEPSGLEIAARIDRTYGDTAVSVMWLERG